MPSLGQGGHTQPGTPPPCPLTVHDARDCNSDAVVAVYDLVKRLLPQHAHIVRLLEVEKSPDSHGFFSVEVKDGTVHIAGTSGVELASGVHWFLKYFCSSSVSWDLTGGLQISTAALRPSKLKELESKGCVTVERAVQHTFYQNVVTLSYSMAFWDTERWVSSRFPASRTAS